MPRSRDRDRRRRRSAPFASRSRAATARCSTPRPSSTTARALAASRGRPVKDVQAAGREGVPGPVRPLAPTGVDLVRFYLTTAIDYVNSRPHLGTAYEKITADVIARYKRLSRRRDALPDGQRRALAERLQAGARARPRSAGLLRPDGAGVPRRLGRSSTSRSTTSSARPSRGTARRCRSWRRRCYDAGDIYEGVYEGWYCVSCEAFKQEKDLVDGKCPLHPTLTPEWIREKNYFFRLSKYRDRLLDALRGAPGVPAARHPPQRDPAAARSGPRGHLGQPRRAVVGHPAAVRARQRRLRLVRRADQLRRGGRLRHRRRALRAVVAGRPARHRQGHHAVPHRGLAGDADERRPRAAAAGVRPRLGQLRRPAHEQVARHERRSGRRRRDGSAPTRCGCT